MKNTVKRSSLFLTELIIDIFIFAVWCCRVRRTADSSLRHVAARVPNSPRKVYVAQSAAERFRQGEDISSGCPFPKRTPTARYAAGDNACEDDDYVVKPRSTRTDGLRTAKLLIRKSEPRTDSASIRSYRYRAGAEVGAG